MAELRIGRHREAGLLGIDVTLRYTFPAEGLDATALGTLFMLVVSGASQLRLDLLAGSQR